MRFQAGSVINLASENAPVKGCTVSEQVYQENGNTVFVFSLAEHTEISAESYEYPKLLAVCFGELTVFAMDGREWKLAPGESIVTPLKMAVGMKSSTGCVYTEISWRKEDHMSDMIHAGEVFTLKNLLPYQEGKILNMDISSNDKMKFVVMSFDAGCALAEHAAPGEALVFALDGEAVIGYEGKESPLKAGETFKFDKMGRHFVKAVTRFKMALLLVLD